MKHLTRDSFNEVEHQYTNRVKIIGNNQEFLTNASLFEDRQEYLTRDFFFEENL